MWPSRQTSGSRRASCPPRANDGGFLMRNCSRSDQPTPTAGLMRGKVIPFGRVETVFISSDVEDPRTGDRECICGVAVALTNVVTQLGAPPHSGRMSGPVYLRQIVLG